MKPKIRFVACDPDTKTASYAVIDEQGNLVDAWCVKSKDLQDSAVQHRLDSHEADIDTVYIKAVESQQLYQGDDPAKVKSLLVLARACGISMAYLAERYPSPFHLTARLEIPSNATSDIYAEPCLILPREWSKSRNKKQNQFWCIKKMGMTVIECAGYCAAKELLPRFKKTEQKHLLDAVCIAQFAREQYQKKQMLNNFKQSIK